MRDVEPAEYYNRQIQLMRRRFAVVLRTWGVNPADYYERLGEALGGSPLFLYEYLVGFDKVVIEVAEVKGRAERKELLKKRTGQRIYRIIGSFIKEREYVRSL